MRLIADSLNSLQNLLNVLRLLQLQFPDTRHERLRIPRHLRVRQQELQALETADLLHPALVLELVREPGTRIREGTTEDRDRVVDSARIAMQDLLGEEGPSVDFFGRFERDGAAT